MKKISTKILLLSFMNTLLIILILGGLSVYSVMQTQKSSLETLENSMRQSFDLLISSQVESAMDVLEKHYELAQKGELTLKEAKDKAAEIIRDMRYGQDGYFWIDTTEGVNVVLYGSEAEGKMRYDNKDSHGNPFIKDIIEKGMEEGGGYSDFYFNKEGSDVPLPKRGYSLEFKPFGWVMGTGNYTDDIDETILAEKQLMEEQTDKQIKILIGLSLSIFIVFIIISFFLGSKIAKPIEESSNLIEKISQGDFTIQIPTMYLNRKDEIGQISNSLDHMIENLKDMLTSVQKESAISSNEFLEVNKSIIILQEQINNVASTTEEISAGMEETSASSQQMNSTAMEIEHATESIAHKAQEGAKTANEIYDRAMKLKSKVTVSQENAMKVLGESRESLEKAIEESKSVDKITHLSDGILQITSQTNLLALNAAIEAARAGEAGKGFAVVANEIRQLADDSKSIAEQIQEIIKVVGDSVSNLAFNSNKLLEYISTDVKDDYTLLLDSTDQYGKDAESVNDLTMDFSATSEELLASIQNMMRAIEEIAIATNEGAEGVGNIAESSGLILEGSNEIIKGTQEVDKSTKKLEEAVKKFKLE